jgi:hypothetical protein
MSLTGVSSALVRHQRSVSWVKVGAETFVKGKLTRAASVTATIQLAHFPLSARDLKFQEQGTYTAQDRKFYQIGGTHAISEKDELVLGSEKFSVMQVTDRISDGGYIVYLAKRVANQ